MWLLQIPDGSNCKNEIREIAGWDKWEKKYEKYNHLNHTIFINHLSLMKVGYAKTFMD